MALEGDGLERESFIGGILVVALLDGDVDFFGSGDSMGTSASGVMDHLRVGLLVVQLRKGVVDSGGNVVAVEIPSVAGVLL